MCFFFPHGGRSLPAFVHLHPWDAVDVLLGLLCPPIVVFVNLCVTELSFLFFVHVGLLSDAVIFLVWFCLFHPRGSHMFLLADLSYVVFSQLRFTGMSYCLFLVCRLLRAFWHLSSSVRLLTPNLFRAAYFVFVSSLSLSLASRLPSTTSPAYKSDLTTPTLSLWTPFATKFFPRRIAVWGLEIAFRR